MRSRHADSLLDGADRGPGTFSIPRERSPIVEPAKTLRPWDKGPDSDGIVHPMGEWSCRAMWWVQHAKGMEALMAIGIHGQWIQLDPTRKIAIVEQSSQPVSKDTLLDGFDLAVFYALVEYLRDRQRWWLGSDLGQSR